MQFENDECQLWQLQTDFIKPIKLSGSCEKWKPEKTAWNIDFSFEKLILFFK